MPDVLIADNGPSTKIRQGLLTSGGSLFGRMTAILSPDLSLETIGS